MLLLLFFIFYSIKTAPINRVSVTTSYNVLTTNDVMGCQTNILNTFNITVNLYAASSGTLVLCVTDEGGVASENPIKINAAGSDLFYPGATGQYVLESDFKTSCFYSDGLSSWRERRF